MLGAPNVHSHGTLRSAAPARGLGGGSLGAGGGGGGVRVGVEGTPLQSIESETEITAAPRFGLRSPRLRRRTRCRVAFPRGRSAGRNGVGCAWAGQRERRASVP